MARIDLNDRWAAAGPVARLQTALHAFLRARGMWVIGEQPGEIHARQGRWLGRVLGGRLAAARWLPKVAVVRLRTEGGESDVRASIEEAAAEPITDRLRNRYRAYFVRWMDDLKAALR